VNISETLDINFQPGSAAVALGFFDGLHLGHMAVIRETVRQAKINGLTPCVFTFTTLRGGPSPKDCETLVSQRISEQILAAEGIREIIRPAFSAFGDLSPAKFVRDILIGSFGAASVICGEDYRFGKNASGNAETLSELCGGDANVTVIPSVWTDIGGEVPISSSIIRALLREGDVRKAAKLLGRPFSIDFTVTGGRRLGRTLGAPTINQHFPDSFIKPKFGVYASVSHVDGSRFSSVTNVGIKPTVGSDAVLAETYIHGFSGDLYGQDIQVDLLAFIRPEQKFESVDQLKSQILLDSEEARKIAKILDNS